MSDTVMDDNEYVSGASQSRPFDPSKHLKLRKCDGRGAAGWLETVMDALVVIGNAWSDAEKCLWFSTLLKGDAEKWYCYYRKYMRENGESVTFEGMLQVFRLQFCRDADKLMAKDKLDDLIMRRGMKVSEYARQFQNLAMVAGVVRDTDLVDKFLRGLRVDLRTDLRVRLATGQLEEKFQAVLRAAEHFDAAVSYANYGSRSGGDGHYRHNNNNRSNRSQTYSNNAIQGSSTGSTGRRRQEHPLDIQMARELGFQKSGNHWRPKTDNRIPRDNPPAELYETKAAALSAADGKGRLYQHPRTGLWAGDILGNKTLCHRCLHYGHMRTACPTIN